LIPVWFFFIILFYPAPCPIPLTAPGA